MNKYAKYDAPPKEKPWTIHPVWRGIGCLLIILIPLMAFAAGTMVKSANEENGWFAVPPELDRYPDMAKAEKALPGLAPVFSWIESIYVFDLALTVLFTIIGFALFTVAYSIFYATMGPPRYGPTDAPPLQKRRYHRTR